MYENLSHIQCPDIFESWDSTSAEYQSLQNPETWKNIPLLNYTPLHLLKDLQLVRFRGFIQDMQDPEIYLQRYEVRNTQNDTKRMQNGKYRDCLLLKPNEEVSYESEANIQGERRTFFVVSIPGINKWASDYEEQSNCPNIPKMEKQSSTGSSKKRAAPEDDMDVDTEVTAAEAKASCNQDCEPNKRLCKQAEKANEKAPPQTTLSADYLLNSPIPERPSKACMVKIYKDFDDYTLNAVVDVIGFLSVNPALDCTHLDVEMCGLDEDNVNELHAKNPPPSLIPRLHAISVQILPHHNPLMDARFLAPTLTTTIDNESFNMLSIQKDLRMVLTLCFFNDDLAAEYMLSHLISHVYSRSEFQSIGKFSLNICNLPSALPADYTKKLYEMFELMLPSSHYLPMNLETLNTAAFMPKKDYETNKLISGLLQLAPQTHLVLDETQMEQGKLENSGVIAIQNLAQLLRHQQIKCNFQYYEISYNADIPVLVLSEGRSMLPNDFTVPLNIDAQSVELMEETLKAARHYLQPERLDHFRRYLTKAKLASYDMNPEDSEMVQNDFVEMRKSGIINSADDLHSLLVLSRLLGIARGKTVFDKESWEFAKELESKRRNRIQKLPKSNRNIRN